VGSGLGNGLSPISPLRKASSTSWLLWICFSGMFQLETPGASLDGNSGLAGLEWLWWWGKPQDLPLPIRVFALRFSGRRNTHSLRDFWDDEQASARQMRSLDGGKFPLWPFPATAPAQASSLFWMAIAQGFMSGMPGIEADPQAIGNALVPHMLAVRSDRFLNPAFGTVSCPFLSVEEIAILGEESGSPTPFAVSWSAPSSTSVRAS